MTLVITNAVDVPRYRALVVVVVVLRLHAALLEDGMSLMRGAFLTGYVTHTRVNELATTLYTQCPCFWRAAGIPQFRRSLRFADLNLVPRP